MGVRTLGGKVRRDFGERRRVFYRSDPKLVRFRVAYLGSVFSMYLPVSDQLTCRQNVMLSLPLSFPLVVDPLPLVLSDDTPLRILYEYDRPAFLAICLPRLPLCLFVHGKKK
jgi:hypothetical protein